ncbi:MAG: alpha/beta hydrolase [Lachnospiraceae bacterium]|nr:alpha/beta hydrolase [Lachnospiraceae bacterium]
MFYHAKNETLNLCTTTMDYVTFGTGTKPLVIIPGLSVRGVKGAAASLAYMYRLFAKEFKVYVFDRKAELPEVYTVREIAADVAEAMRLLEISNADVFGVSQGGMIAQYLAIDHPELVHKVVLGVTLSRNNTTVEQVIADWISMAEQGDFDGFVQDMLYKMYSDAYIKKYHLLLPVAAKFSKPKDFGRFIILAKACLTCNTYDELDKIKCPVLVLGGKKDKIVNGQASEELAEKLQCECYMYDDLGHAAYEEAKDFNRRIYEFLRK